MQEVYDLIFQESKPQEKEKEKDLYSLIFEESKKPEVEELELPEIEKKEPPFLKKIGRARDFLMPIMMQIPGLREQFRVPERKAGQPPYPEMRALTTKEEETAEKRIVPEEKGRIRYEEWGGFVNYMLENQPGRVAMWLTAFAGTPVLIGLFELLQQAKNIGMSLKDKAKYDPLAQRMLSEMVPEDSPGWVKGLAVTGEVGAEMVLVGLGTGAIREGAFRKHVNKIIDAGKKLGWEEFQASKGGRSLDELKEIALKYAKRGTVEQEIKNMMSKVEGKIPSPLTRRVAEPSTFVEPEIKMPARLAPPVGKRVTPEGIVFEPGVPEAKVLEAGYRAVEPKAAVNIMPKPDGSFDITFPKPEIGIEKKGALESLWAIFKAHPRVLYKDFAKYPYIKEGTVTSSEAAEYFESRGKEVIGKPEAKIVKEKKAPTFKDPLHQIIFGEGRIKPNQDYSRKELLKILPPRLIASEKDPSAKPMDLMAQSVKREFPFIEGDVDLYDELLTRKGAPVEEAFKKAEREKIKRGYEEFEEKRAAEEKPEEEPVKRWEEAGFVPPEKAPPRTLEQKRAYAKEMIKGKTTGQLKKILPNLEAGERAVVEKEIKAREEKPKELYRMPPAAKKLEKLFKEGKLSAKELTGEEKEFLKERGMYEEGKPPPKAKPLPESEIEEAAERPILTKISVEDPTGKIETFEITESRIGKIREYAKNLGILEKVKIGQPYPGSWKEHYSPAEHEKTIKQFLRDVKTVPKEEWELYSGYPFTKEIKEAVAKVQERLKTKRRIKLEELEGELKKTDKGKVEWMYLETERQLKERRKPSFKKAFRGAKRAFVDTSGNIKKDLIKNLGPLGKEAKIQHELIAGASAKGERLFEEASKEIYKGLSRDDEALLNRAIQSRRTIAISEYKPEVKHPMGLTEKEHSDYMKTIPEEINKKADRYFKEMEKILDNLKSEGLIDEQTCQNLKSKGDYSPRRFIQYIDPERTYIIAGKTITVPDSGLKSLDEGSYKVMETNSRLLLADVISRTQSRIFRNRANQAAYEIADSVPDNGIFRKAKVYKTTKEGKPIYQKAPAGHTKIKVMIKGKAKELIMPDEYAKEWIQRDPLITQTMAEIIGWGSGTKILKAMATGYNPGFAVTNLPRDIAHIWIVTSEYSSFLPIQAFQIAKDLRAVKKDAFLRKGRFADYVDEGGMMTFLTHQGKLFGDSIKQVKVAQKVMGYAGESSEIWTRLALRERAIKKGKAPYEATWIARNYLDFFQGGSVMKALDAGFPYVNAGIQGTRGIFRALADRPVQTLWKFAQLGALATGLYLAANYASEEIKECYDHIPDRDKVNNFCIPTPWRITDKNGNERHFYFKIAKDQGQRIVCTIFENLMAKVLGKEVNADQISQSIQEFIPIIPTETLPPGFEAMMGYMANKDFWTREDIWKGAKVEAKEEYNEYTHPALVKAGEVTGMSPKRLGYALSQIFTRGNIYTGIANAGLTMVMRNQPKEERRKTTAEIVEKLPIIRRVFNLTPPYSEAEIKKVEKATIEESTRRLKQKRELGKMANSYYRKLKDEKIKDQSILDEARAFIKEQPTEDRKRLATWFKNYGRVYAIPERFWWLELAEMPPEARATVFWTKYLESDKEERKELQVLAKKIPGLWSERFLKRLRILINKWKRESE